MNKVLQNIETQIGAAHIIINKNTLVRDNCSADLTGIPTQRVVVDMDSVLPSGQHGRKHCDYVIFFLNTSENTLFAVPIELKTGTIKGSAQQLQQGADFAAHHAPSTPKNTCVPVLCHKGIPKLARRALQKSKVRFRGLKITVETTRCGVRRNIATALSKSSFP